MIVIIVNEDADDTELLRSAVADVDAAAHCLCVESCKKLMICLSDPKLCPDLILMDVRMPQTDSIECIKALRQEPRYADVQIIAMATMAIPGQQREFTAIGVTLLFKPNNYETLVTAVRDLFRSRSTPRT